MWGCQTCSFLERSCETIGEWGQDLAYQIQNDPPIELCVLALCCRHCRLTICKKTGQGKQTDRGRSDHGHIDV